LKNQILHFACLFLLLLVTGLFWGTWFALSRSIETFSAAEFIHIGKTIIQNVARPMRIIMPACILFMALTTWLYPSRKSLGFYLNALALLLILITLYITVGIEVPIDNQIKTWTAATVPSDWEKIRERWQFFHTFRTLTSLACFGSFLLSVLFIKK
jgi:uncharacterized membrane protein